MSPRSAWMTISAAIAFALAAVSPYLWEWARPSTELMAMPMHAAISPMVWIVAALAVAATLGVAAHVRRDGGLRSLSPTFLGWAGAALVAGALLGFDLCGCGITDGSIIGFSGCHCWITGLVGALAGLLAVAFAREAKAFALAFAAYVAGLIAALAAITFVPVPAYVRIAAVRPRAYAQPCLRRRFGRAPPPLHT